LPLEALRHELVGVDVVDPDDPEGWARTAGASDVTFRDKNNIVHVFVKSGPAPTTASVAAG
jgi:hypothetical protein